MNDHGEGEEPAIRRGLGSSLLRAVITGLLVAAVLAYLAWAGRSSIDRASDRIHRIEITDLFRKAVDDGLVPDPPHPAEDFHVTTGHGNEPDFVKYTTAQGKPISYSAVRGPSGQWEFRSLDDDPRLTFVLAPVPSISR